MRNFLLPTVFSLALAASVLPALRPGALVRYPQPMQQPAPKTEKLLRHAVLFKFKDTATPEQIKSVEEAFKALPAQIPEIVSLEWGLNNSPEGLAQGFTHLFFLSFRDEEGRAKYLPHPAHKAFGQLLGPHLDKVLVLDYWAQS